MNGRKLKILTAIAAVLTLGEFASAVQIGLGSDPWAAGFAVAFGVFFGLGTWLLRSGRVGGGAIFTGILCLFELVEFPSWPSPSPTTARDSSCRVVTATAWPSCVSAPRNLAAP